MNYNFLIVLAVLAIVLGVPTLIAGYREGKRKKKR
jgi:hypothetical protein